MGATNGALFIKDFTVGFLGITSDGVRQKAPNQPGYTLHSKLNGGDIDFHFDRFNPYSVGGVFWAPNLRCRLWLACAPVPGPGVALKGPVLSASWAIILLCCLALPVSGGNLAKVWELDLSKWSKSSDKFAVDALSFSPDGKRLALTGVAVKGEADQLTSALRIIRMAIAEAALGDMMSHPD